MQLYVTAIASKLIFNDCPIIYVWEIRIIMFVSGDESLRSLDAGFAFVYYISFMERFAIKHELCRYLINLLNDFNMNFV